MDLSRAKTKLAVLLLLLLLLPVAAGSCAAVGPALIVLETPSFG